MLLFIVQTLAIFILIILRNIYGALGACRPITKNKKKTGHAVV